jgi:phosphatidylserine/phosphatidylglycerophosphate/cardiolipin synthase-like enzyme
MKRTLVAVMVTLLGVALGPSAPTGAATSATTSATLPTSVITQVFVEPGAGYGFFSSALASARHDIDLSMYELKDPVIEAQLVAKARSGVRVRVLLDTDDGGRSDNAAAVAVLRSGGVHVTWAPSGQIFHAKYLVIDGSRAYIGSGNLVRYDYSSTRDFWVLDQVAGDLAAIETTFASDFSGVSHTPVAHGGLVWSPGSSTALTSVIASARHSLLVENEEMDDYAIEQSLDAASARGVSVTVVMTRSSSYLSALKSLVQHGVRVELLSSSQLYVHAKAICADCSTTTGTLFVGSENFSTSSLDYNRELGVTTQSLVAIRAVWTSLLTDAAVGTRLAP